VLLTFARAFASTFDSCGETPFELVAILGMLSPFSELREALWSGLGIVRDWPSGISTGRLAADTLAPKCNGFSC
jgi:hypothetical protein